MSDHGDPSVSHSPDPEPPNTEYARLLRAINNKLGWVIAFLVLITLNTCGLADDIGDEIRGNDRPAAAEKENS